jgi:two-component system cell cycle response regulator
MATILIVDDSAAARAEIRAAVSGSDLFGLVREAPDGIGGLRALLEEPVDIVVCDLEMPGLGGEKLLDARRCRPDGETIPFLFITADRDPQRRARLLRAGASDIVTKPFHAVDLAARLEAHLRMARLQAELREKNAMLEHLSTTDTLTGLRTRRYGDELIAIEVLRARRYRQPLTALMVDLDYFKRVNDEHGHPAGDAVLAGVGAVLRRTLRATDVATRYGGEEILVLLPNTDLRGGAVLAERLRASVAASSHALPSGRTLSVTASLGAASFGERAPSAAALVAAADAALYLAKRRGRNTVALSGDSIGLDSAAGSRTRDAEAARRGA